MGEAKKIVIEGFPVEKLPAELRAQLNGIDPVRVTVEQGVSGEAQNQMRPLHEMRGFAEGVYAKAGIDPVEYIRELRDEWD